MNCSNGASKDRKSTGDLGREKTAAHVTENVEFEYLGQFCLNDLDVLENRPSTIRSRAARWGRLENSPASQAGKNCKFNFFRANSSGAALVDVQDRSENLDKADRQNK